MTSTEKPAIQPSESAYRLLADATLEREYLSVSALLARVNADGRISADMLTRISLVEKRLCINVTTSDLNPTVSLHFPGLPRFTESLLAEREQTGPDSWDYPVALREYSDEVFIRLTMNGDCEDIAVLSADATVVLTRGWVDPTAHPAPALVKLRDLDEARERLLARSATTCDRAGTSD